MTDTSSAESGRILDYPEMRRQVSPPATKTVDQTSNIILLIQEWRNILNARLLAVIALLGALAIFGFTISSPDPSRLWACAGYSVGVLWPIIYLYLKRGDQNGH